MGVSPRLPKHLRAALGSEAGEELVTILDEMRAEHAQQMARIDARFDQIDRRFEQVDRRFERMEERFQSLEVKVADVKSDLVKWSFLFWCGAVASIAALAGVLRAP